MAVLRHFRFLLIHLFLGRGGTRSCCFFSVITIYYDGVAGNEGYEGSRGKALVPWSITRALAPEEEPPWAGVICILGEETRNFSPGSCKHWAHFVLFASLVRVSIFASPGLSGYVRQALIVFLSGFPMYVNLGPRFCTVGAEVASVVIIEHHSTTFS